MSKISLLHAPDYMILTPKIEKSPYKLETTPPPPPHFWRPVYAPGCRCLFRVLIGGTETVCIWAPWTVIPILKALFNNVFTFKNVSCMSLHAINAFDKVLKWSPEKKNCTSKAPLSASKKWEWTNDQILSYSFPPPPPSIDCCVRINAKPDRLFSGDIQS